MQSSAAVSYTHLDVYKRQVLDVTEYHADVYYNSQTGERVHAAFLDGVIDDVNCLLYTSRCV